MVKVSASKSTIAKQMVADLLLETVPCGHGSAPEMKKAASLQRPPFTTTKLLLAKDADVDALRYYLAVHGVQQIGAGGVGGEAQLRA